MAFNMDPKKCPMPKMCIRDRPHRYPFALVDRILDYEPGQWAIGRKCVSRNEEFFCGHFPGQPVICLLYTSGLKGMCTCPVTACAGGTNAVGDAFHRIRDGYETAMVLSLIHI